MVFVALNATSGTMGGMSTTTTQCPRPNWLAGMTKPAIEAALRLHIIGGIPMRKAAVAAGCSLSGLRDAKSRHLARISALKAAQK